MIPWCPHQLRRADGNLHSFSTHKICAQSLRQVPKKTFVIFHFFVIFFSSIILLISLFAYETRIRQDMHCYLKSFKKIFFLTLNPVQPCREAFSLLVFKQSKEIVLKRKYYINNMFPEGKDHIKTSTIALSFWKCNILKMREFVGKEHEMKKQRAHDRCKMESVLNF